MVSKKDIREIGFEYFDHLNATRDMLPFTDEELEALVKHRHTDNKRRLSNAFLQYISDLYLKYLLVYGGNKSFYVPVKGGWR